MVFELGVANQFLKELLHWLVYLKILLHRAHTLFANGADCRQVITGYTPSSGGHFTVRVTYIQDEQPVGRHLDCRNTLPWSKLAKCVLSFFLLSFHFLSLFFSFCLFATFVFLFIFGLFLSFSYFPSVNILCHSFTSCFLTFRFIFLLLLFIIMMPLYFLFNSFVFTFYSFTLSAIFTAGRSSGDMTWHYVSFIIRSKSLTYGALFCRGITENLSHETLCLFVSASNSFCVSSRGPLKLALKPHILGCVIRPALEPLSQVSFRLSSPFVITKRPWSILRYSSIFERTQTTRKFSTVDFRAEIRNQNFRNTIAPYHPVGLPS